MKKVLLFSVVLLVGLLCTCDLCAQSCQPGPACKAACSAAKSTMKSDAAPAGMATSVAVNSASTQTTPMVKAVTKTSACNPADCDPTKCDPTKCKPADCDPTKCNPANCKDGKAKSTRI